MPKIYDNIENHLANGLNETLEVSAAIFDLVKRCLKGLDENSVMLTRIQKQI
ncbi:MAG: hypothetical protein H7257_06450 [Taibaiella sp.]|nr:hypothetical protein [Taibaiella sp.]